MLASLVMIVEWRVVVTQEEEIEERQWHGAGALQIHLMSSGTVAEAELYRYREDQAQGSVNGVLVVLGKGKIVGARHVRASDIGVSRLGSANPKPIGTDVRMGLAYSSNEKSSRKCWHAGSSLVLEDEVLSRGLLGG